MSFFEEGRALDFYLVQNNLNDVETSQLNGLGNCQERRIRVRCGIHGAPILPSGIKPNYMDHISKDDKTDFISHKRITEFCKRMNIKPADVLWENATLSERVICVGDQVTILGQISCEFNVPHEDQNPSNGGKCDSNTRQDFENDVSISLAPPSTPIKTGTVCINGIPFLSTTLRGFIARLDSRALKKPSQDSKREGTKVEEPLSIMQTENTADGQLAQISPASQNKDLEVVIVTIGENGKTIRAASTDDEYRQPYLHSPRHQDINNNFLTSISSSSGIIRTQHAEISIKKPKVRMQSEQSRWQEIFSSPVSISLCGLWMIGWLAIAAVESVLLKTEGWKLGLPFALVCILYQIVIGFVNADRNHVREWWARKRLKPVPPPLIHKSPSDAERFEDYNFVDGEVIAISGKVAAIRDGHILTAPLSGRKGAVLYTAKVEVTAAMSSSAKTVTLTESH